MGTACTSSSSKKKDKDSGPAPQDLPISNKDVPQIEIDVVPGDLIPKDLIQRTLKKVDTTDVEDYLQDNNSPNIVNFSNFFGLNRLKLNVLAGNGEKKEGKKGEKGRQQRGRRRAVRKLHENQQEAQRTRHLADHQVPQDAFPLL